MLLLIDIGNTSTAVGLYDSIGIRHMFRLKTSTKIIDNKEYSDVLKGFFLKHKIEKFEGAVISSVVPQATSVVRNAVKRTFGIEAVIVDHKIKTGLKFNVKNMEKIGADRIVNAAAAYKLHKGPALVIDFGTATTFSYITANGQFMGGAIMPGIRISAESLAEKTAKLPMVELKTPERALGHNTDDNIRSGIIFGHAGAVKEIIRRIKVEVRVNFKIIITGGYADLVAPHIKIGHIDPLLTLKGLNIIYELNS